jgi:hypothetical protein
MFLGNSIQALAGDELRYVLAAEDEQMAQGMRPRTEGYR